MRKQYGVIFQAPLCRGHNEDVMESCEVRDANLADLPEDLQKFVETRQRRTAA